MSPVHAVHCQLLGHKPPSSDGKASAVSFTRREVTPSITIVITSSGSPNIATKVLQGALRDRIRAIIRQVCDELGVHIVSGVLSKEHVHMFVEIPPRIAVSDFVRRVKGRSSHRAQMEFPDLGKRYWGRHFWARGYLLVAGFQRCRAGRARSIRRRPGIAASMR
jgi:REP element-mobilizing transposase RayT